MYNNLQAFVTKSSTKYKKNVVINRLKTDQNIITVQKNKTYNIENVYRIYYITRMETYISEKEFVLLNKNSNRQIQSKTVESVNRGCCQ